MVAHKYFTYLDKNRAAKTEVILGDARISMERELKEGSQNYDVIVLDAFSSDAIPAHLLTVESFALYEKHLRHENGKPVGVMAIHISNRYLDLEPVVAAIAKKFGYHDQQRPQGRRRRPRRYRLRLGPRQQERSLYEQSRPSKTLGSPLEPDKELLWTDQFTALFPILK